MDSIRIQPWLEMALVAICDPHPETIERVRAEQRAQLLREYGGLGWMGFRQPESQYDRATDGVWVGTYGYCGVEVDG